MLKNFVGLKEQLKVCLTCSGLLAWIQMLFQKLRWSNNKMTPPDYLRVFDQAAIFFVKTFYI